MTVGSRAEVFHGNADATSGGLTKKDLQMKDGRIISKAASKAAKKSLSTRWICDLGVPSFLLLHSQTADTPCRPIF